MHPITYIQTIRLLFTQPKSINKLLQHHFWFVVRFFVVSFFFISLINSTVLLKKTLPEWLDKLTQTVTQAAEHYPQDLTISWDGQTLLFSPAEQIVIPYPDQLSIDKTELPSTLAVIFPEKETLTQEEAHKLADTTALFYVTQNSLYTNTPSTTGSYWDHFLLSELPGFESSFTIEKTSLPEVIKTVTTYLDQTIKDNWPWIIFLMFLYLLVTKTWIALWYSLVGWLFFKLYPTKMKFKTMFKLSLFLIVIAQTTTSISSALFTEVDTSYLFGLTYLILFFIFFTQLHYKKE